MSYLSYTLSSLPLVGVFIANYNRNATIKSLPPQATDEQISLLARWAFHINLLSSEMASSQKQTCIQTYNRIHKTEEADPDKLKELIRAKYLKNMKITDQQYALPNRYSRCHSISSILSIALLVSLAACKIIGILLPTLGVTFYGWQFFLSYKHTFKPTGWEKQKPKLLQDLKEALKPKSANNLHMRLYASACP